MLKLIPQEQIAPVQIKKKNRKPPGKNTFPPPKLQQKIAAEIVAEKIVLQGACMKFISYVKQAGGKTEQEIEDLIHCLQKSVLSLQKQRQKLVWSKNRKKK